MQNTLLSMAPYESEDKCDCHNCGNRSSLFNFLTKEEIQWVKETRIPVTFKPGEIIRKQGTRMTHVISVTRGIAKLYREDARDTNTILRIVKPTNFIGGQGIYVDQMHHFTVMALVETSVCFIDLQVFKSILERIKA